MSLGHNVLTCLYMVCVYLWWEARYWNEYWIKMIYHRIENVRLNHLPYLYDLGSKSHLILRNSLAFHSQREIDLQIYCVYTVNENYCNYYNYNNTHQIKTWIIHYFVFITRSQFGLQVLSLPVSVCLCACAYVGVRATPRLFAP